MELRNKFETQQAITDLEEAVRSLERRLSALSEMVRVKLEEPTEPPAGPEEDLGLVVIGFADDAGE